MSSESHPRPALPPSYVPDPAPRPRSIGSSEDDHVQLPSYEQRDSSPPNFRSPSLKEFSSVLKRRGKQVAELILTANENLGKSTPTYAEGMPISGRVCLNLDSSPQTIHEVVVTVKGTLITSENSGDNKHFLHISNTVWPPPGGASRPSNRFSMVSNRHSMQLSDATTSSSSGSPPTVSRPSKLSGKQEWPFTIDLPREVVLPHGPRSEPTVFKLPQTYMERYGRVSICYDVSVRVHRSKFRTDYRVNMGIGYIPLIRPDRPSMLRQLAYQEGTQIPSPDIDPLGWFTAEPVHIQGTLFGRSATVTCKLSIPTPLSYTRGTALPLSLRLESTDTQALDLLSAPRAIICRLRRVTKCQLGHMSQWKDATDDSQMASWWPCPEFESNSRHRRRITGELHIAKDSKPTSLIANFAIEYSVVLFPFDAVAFSPTSSIEQPLATIPVEIATMYPRGPHPRMYTPPGYESTDTRPFVAVSRPRYGFAN